VIRAHIARRRTDADRRVLAALRHSTPVGGYDLWVRTGLRSARLYPALARLEAAGLVVGEFETSGAHPRRLYRMARPCPVCAGHGPGCREATT
jgi:DNA-binding PadR family transcriptional regulator